MNGRIKVGIVGTGNLVGIASAHLAGYLLKDEAVVTAVYDKLPKAAEDWRNAKGLRDVAVCESFEQLVSLVDAVSICTPNFTHMDYTVAALQAGKYVMCEKPICVPKDDLTKLETACRSTSAIHMVNFNYRKIPAVKLLKLLIDQGRVGEIYMYRQAMGGNRLSNPAVPFEWRMDKSMSGTGALGDFGSHMLDMACFLAGDGPEFFEELYGFTSTAVKKRPLKESEGLREVENDDCAVFSARGKNGALFSFMASRVGDIGNRIEIVGSKAIVQFDIRRPLSLQIEEKEAGSAFTGASGTIFNDEYKRTDRWADSEKPVSAAFVSCADNVMDFVDAVATGTQPPCGLLHGIYIQRLINQLDK